MLASAENSVYSQMMNDMLDVLKKLNYYKP